MTWTLGLIHDGAVDLKVAIAGSDVPPQRFQISFTDLSDLTKRIGGLIHSRMHRIRYVWPYDEKSPTVIRDVDFSVPVGTVLEARKITWLNPGRNAFREGDRFDVAVKSADFFRFSLDDTRFPKAPDGTGWAYDPMSNTAFRVVLVRPVGGTVHHAGADRGLHPAPGRRGHRLHRRSCAATSGPRNAESVQPVSRSRSSIPSCTASGVAVR